MLLFQLLQPPNSFRHRNVDGRLFDREGGTFRHVAWGFLRLKGPEVRGGMAGGPWEVDCRR